MRILARRVVGRVRPCSLEAAAARRSARRAKEWLLEGRHPLPAIAIGQVVLRAQPLIELHIELRGVLIEAQVLLVVVRRPRAGDIWQRDQLQDLYRHRTETRGQNLVAGELLPSRSIRIAG